MLSLEGTQLGNYDVMRRIRVGGMGAVYEGRQRTAFGRRVAIKVILGDFATDRDMRRRFAREARTIAGLHHPHILPLIEFGDEQGILYLVMPFIDGGTLTSYLRHHLPDLGEVMALYQQLLDAVEYAHEHNLIHRDIKSSNVLLEMRRNAAPYVYLADFGLVRTMRQNDSSQVGKPIPLEQVPGTPHYMAPEQTRGIVTPLTDIYALGVLLYQVLTGNLPYNDPDEVRVIKMHLYDPIPSPCDYDGSIPQELGEVVRIAMAKNPADRYQSVAQLRQAFLSALAEPGVTPAVNDSEEEMPPIESVDAAPVDLEILPSAELRKQQVPLTIKLPPSEPYMPAEAEPRRPLPGPNQRRISDPLEVDAAGRQRLTKALKRTGEYAGAESPRPIIMQQRPRITGDRPMERERLPERDRPLNPGAPLNDAPATIIRERRDRNDRQARMETIETGEHNGRNERGNRVYATSDTFRRPRNTDDPFPPVMRRQRRPILAALAVVVVLTLIFVLVTRLFGMELFPTSVPIIGASPVATVRISVKQQTLQNTFLLTASPQFSSPDLTTHSIPDRVIQESAQGSSTVATTGNNTSKGTSAHGMIEFLNRTANPVQVQQGLVLNGPVGIQVLITQSITVQPKQGDQFGKADAPAITIQPGQAGNIATNQVSGTCCNAALFIRNPAPFTGGTDPQSSHFVAQSDIDNAQKALATKLEQQISPQLQQRVGAGESMVGAPDYQITTSTDNPVNTQTDTVTVSVKVTGSATLYKKDVAVQTAMVLLNQQAIGGLGNNYQLQGRQTVASFDAESGKNNIAYLKVSVSGTWAYNFTDSQAQNLRDPIRGATRDVALAYLKAQPGVASVDIHLPLGTDHLPDAVGNIEVMLERSN
ncbi:serine/threonine protein kinase [Ktedonobacteria bacterium brp13]|nr:serine/threonine protein kinase [Ktedonobacteria bacterium brp13]